MSEYPKLPLWTDSYLGDTHHLTTIQHGAFLLLLITMWRSKTRTLPDDDKLLARYTHLSARQWSRIRPMLMPFFEIKNGVLQNGRLLDEYDSVKRYSMSQSNKGKASALKRLHRNATGAQPDCQPNSTPNTSTNPNPKVVSKKKAAAQLSVPGWVPREAWEAYEEMRVKSRRPFTPRARQMVIKKLQGLKTDGHDVSEVLNNSTMSGWPGVYPVPQKKLNGHGDHQKSSLDNHLIGIAGLIADRREIAKKHQP